VDADNDSLALPLVYSWYRNGTALAGATASTYALTLSDRTQPLQCEVTVPLNADGFGSAQVGPVRTSQSMVYLNSDPRVDDVEVSPPTAVTGTTLTCSFSVSDPDGDTLSSSSNFRRIRWFADDGFIKNEIPGQTSVNLLVGQADRGKKLTCQVTLLADADGAGSAESTPRSSSNTSTERRRGEPASTRTPPATPPIRKPDGTPTNLGSSPSPNSVENDEAYCEDLETAPRARPKKPPKGAEINDEVTLETAP
jgi:hypothetical protein